jgi:hypothetical protein
MILIFNVFMLCKLRPLNRENQYAILLNFLSVLTE